MQTELQAIRLACGHLETILEEKPELKSDYTKLVILSDSRSALAALDKIETRSKTVKDTKEALNSLSKILPVETRWIMSHKGITGNEIADRAAKAGTKLRNIERTTQSKTAVKEHVNCVMYEAWNQRWTDQPSCRQTKIFLPTIDRGKSKKIMALNKASLSILVRNVTGHAHLDRHRKVMGDYGRTDEITPDFLDHINGVDRTQPTLIRQSGGPLDTVDTNLATNYGTCRLCEQRGTEETPIHLVLQCPYTWIGRAELFGEYDPSPETFANWDPAGLSHFFARYNLENT